MVKAGAFLVGLCALATSAASAQTYPSRNITLIVPFAAGGSNDIVGRTVGKKLADAWRQPVLIENRPGAGGVIGAAAVAAAAPDGYTLLLVSSTFTINPAIKKSMPFDTARDFTPIAFVARSPLLLTASNTLPVTSAGELFDRARSMPEKITYASAGPGSINQISAELIALSAGVRFLHVPYKGGAPALNDLLGGHVDIYVSSLPQVIPLAQSGQAKALAVTSLKRTPLLPEVPTLDESGLPGFESSSWWGIAGPAGMPTVVVDALNAEVGRMLASPEVRNILANEGADAETMTPQQFAELMRAETQRWIRVARAANISVD